MLSWLLENIKTPPTGLGIYWYSKCLGSLVSPRFPSPHRNPIFGQVQVTLTSRQPKPSEGKGT